MRDDFPSSIESSRNYIKNIIQNSLQYYFAITYSDEFIGEIHVAKQNDILKYSGFLGYWLGEKYWSRGFMSEVLRVMNDFIFTETDINRIFCRVFANNLPSIRVLEKAGFEKEGEFKNAIFKDGRFLNQYQYCLLKT